MARKQVAYWSCSEQCYVAKLIFVKQWSTIFGVRELWWNEKLFCESWLKCTPWNVNCQTPRMCTRTLKINIEGIKSLIWLNDLLWHLVAWFNFQLDQRSKVNNIFVQNRETKNCCSWTRDDLVAPLNSCTFLYFLIKRKWTIEVSRDCKAINHLKFEKKSSTRAVSLATSTVVK